MKKIALIAAGLMTISSLMTGTAAESCPLGIKDSCCCQDTCNKILMYLPNRVADFSDIVNIKLGAGSESSLEAGITNYAKWGASYGSAYYLTKEANRQYGGALEEGFFLQDTIVTKEKLVISDTFGTVKPFFMQDRAFHAVSPNAEIYKEGIRDFWEISVKAGVLVNAKVSVSPVEIADAVCGLVLVDIKDDDAK